MTTNSEFEKKNTVAENAENPWLKVIHFLQDQGMIEVKTITTIKPIKKESGLEVPLKERKEIIQSVLRRNSHILSLKLREDFSLSERKSDKTNFSTLDGLLSDFKDENEDSLSVLRSVRERI